MVGRNIKEHQNAMNYCVLTPSRKELDLTNKEEIREILTEKNMRFLNTDSDSEVLLNVFAHELQKQGTSSPTQKEIFQAVRATHKRVRGAYSVIFMINGVGIVGFRDPFGIRPLIFGKRENDLLGSDYILASESTVLDTLGLLARSPLSRQHTSAPQYHRDHSLPPPPITLHNLPQPSNRSSTGTRPRAVKKVREG